MFIDAPDALSHALSTIDEAIVGVDVERADGGRYFRRAALIQVGTADHVLLVDPVAMDPVPLLGDFLTERITVLHAIHNDLEPLREAGVEVGEVHDTAVAAALLGLPTGLDPLLRELLGVSLSPDKERFQRADWGQRPLPDDMADYAAADVAHLPALWKDLAARLDDSDRREWYDEELAFVVAGAFEDTRDWSRTRGAGRLPPVQREVLRALWEEREAIAREFDLAPNRVLRDGTLLDLAQNPATDAPSLIRRNQRRGRPTLEHAERLLAAQRRGLDAEPERSPSPGPWSRTQREAYDAMRQARSAVAERLGIDPGVLCPSKVLWGPARGNPRSKEELCRLAGLRRWQCRQLADALWDAYQQAMAPAEQ